MTERNPGLCNTNTTSTQLIETTLPGDGDSPYSLESYSEHRTLLNKHGSPAGCSSPISMDSSDIDARLTRSISPAYQFQTYLCYTSPAALSDHSTAAKQAGEYPNSDPDYPQFFTAKQPPPSSSPQSQEPVPDLNTRDFFSISSPLPDKPTRSSRSPDARPGSARLVCSCGTTFGRRTDLERHLRTSKVHNKASSGPACPVGGCKYTSRFGRVDNFRTHYVRQHGISPDEADSFIREWISRGRL